MRLLTPKTHNPKHTTHNAKRTTLNTQRPDLAFYV